MCSTLARDKKGNQHPPNPYRLKNFFHILIITWQIYKLIVSYCSLTQWPRFYCSSDPNTNLSNQMGRSLMKFKDTLKPGLSYQAILHVTNLQRATASLSGLNKRGMRKYYYLLWGFKSAFSLLWWPWPPSRLPGEKKERKFINRGS